MVSPPSLCTIMAIIMIGIITLFAGMATNYSNQLREGLTVELMLTDSITPQQMTATQARLKAAPWARQVTYISQEQGLRDMNEAMGTDIGTFDGTSPVPAEFEVSLNAPYANLDSIKRYEPSMLAMPGVAEVKVSLEEARAEIAYDPQLVKPTQFKQAIEGAGFDVVCDGTCPESCAS